MLERFCRIPCQTVSTVAALVNRRVVKSISFVGTHLVEPVSNTMVG